MSGLLHRLAALAIGVAPTARPVAGTMLFPPQQNREMPRASESASRVEPRTERREVAAGRGHPARDTEPTALATAPDRGGQVPPGMMGKSWSQAEPAARLAPNGVSEEPAPAGTDAVATGFLPEPAGPLPRRAGEQAASASRDLRSHHIEYRVPRGAARQEREARFAPDPPRLFANRPREEKLPMSALPATRTRGSAGTPAVEETTEVHVSIGRIEVTAVHEAPPPKREPGRSRTARSLDEYLAGREERRS